MSYAQPEGREGYAKAWEAADSEPSADIEDIDDQELLNALDAYSGDEYFIDPTAEHPNVNDGFEEDHGDERVDEHTPVEEHIPADQQRVSGAGPDSEREQQEQEQEQQHMLGPAAVQGRAASPPPQQEQQGADHLLPENGHQQQQQQQQQPVQQGQGLQVLDVAAHEQAECGACSTGPGEARAEAREEVRGEARGEALDGPVYRSESSLSAGASGGSGGTAGPAAAALAQVGAAKAVAAAESEDHAGVAAGAGPSGMGGVDVGAAGEGRVQDDGVPEGGGAGAGGAVLGGALGETDIEDQPLMVRRLKSRAKRSARKCLRIGASAATAAAAPLAPAAASAPPDPDAGEQRDAPIPETHHRGPPQDPHARGPHQHDEHGAADGGGDVRAHGGRGSSSCSHPSPSHSSGADPGSCMAGVGPHAQRGMHRVLRDGGRCYSEATDKAAALIDRHARRLGLDRETYPEGVYIIQEAGELEEARRAGGSGSSSGSEDEEEEDDDDDNDCDFVAGKGRAGWSARGCGRSGRGARGRGRGAGCAGRGKGKKGSRQGGKDAGGAAGAGKEAWREERRWQEPEQGGEQIPRMVVRALKDVSARMARVRLGTGGRRRGACGRGTGSAYPQGRARGVPCVCVGGSGKAQRRPVRLPMTACMSRTCIHALWLQAAMPPHHRGALRQRCRHRKCTTHRIQYFGSDALH